MAGVMGGGGLGHCQMSASSSASVAVAECYPEEGWGVHARC